MSFVIYRSTLEANKASFTEEELAVVSADIETIRGIEKEITELQNQLSAAGAFADGTSVKENSNPFPGFTGKDLEGNDVDAIFFPQIQLLQVVACPRLRYRPLYHGKGIRQHKEVLKAAGNQIFSKADTCLTLCHYDAVCADFF